MLQAAALGVRRPTVSRSLLLVFASGASQIAAALTIAATGAMPSSTDGKMLIKRLLAGRGEGFLLCANRMEAALESKSAWRVASASAMDATGALQVGRDAELS